MKLLYMVFKTTSRITLNNNENSRNSKQEARWNQRVDRLLNSFYKMKVDAP